MIKKVVVAMIIYNERTMNSLMTVIMAIINLITMVTGLLIMMILVLSVRAPQ